MWRIGGVTVGSDLIEEANLSSDEAELKVSRNSNEVKWIGNAAR